MSRLPPGVHRFHVPASFNRQARRDQLSEIAAVQDQPRRRRRALQAARPLERFYGLTNGTAEAGGDGEVLDSEDWL
jgi:hypothetical protein